MLSSHHSRWSALGMLFIKSALMAEEEAVKGTRDAVVHLQAYNLNYSCHVVQLFFIWTQVLLKAHLSEAVRD